MAKFITYNRITLTYTIGSKKVKPKEWWFMAKFLIINKPGCLVQDDRNCLMYQN
ncbi:hypothetical protein [Flavobacterium sp.]|uniref:hypothetical protein n=1 Tax=Flavobacterium sp. TaxID=239 RepID=UPI00260EDC91|nr:hypothetical protein [Flavobacterium sp.]